MKYLIIICVIILGLLLTFFTLHKSKQTIGGKVIVLNGPSGSGKSSIQKEFQKLMMPNLWLKVGIDSLFDGVMPDITPNNLSFWQSQNPIRWVETSNDEQGNTVVTLKVGVEGEKVVYAMNSAIAAYVANGCNVIIDYIAYDPSWLQDLEKKLRPFKTYYIAVEIPLNVLETREAARATSPKGHARSHYASVYGTAKYDLHVNSHTDSAYTIAQHIKELVDKD